LTRSLSSAMLRLGAGEGDAPVVEEIHSSGSLAFRPTKWGVWMVGTAAHPIGGDRLRLRVTVGPGCHAEVRSVAATLARRGPGPGQTTSWMGTAIRLGPGASLTWSPEPGIAALGAHHASDTRVRLARDSSLFWREEIALGRHGDGPGTWRSRIRITIAGRPLLSSELALGPEAPGWDSTSVLAEARAVSMLAIIDGAVPRPEPQPVRRLSRGTASAISLPLAWSGAHITAWGGVLADCRSAVDQLVQSSGMDVPLPVRTS
jgi:urease accessory protein